MSVRQQRTQNRKTGKHRGASSQRGRSRFPKLNINVNTRSIASVFLLACVVATSYFAYAALNKASQRPIQSVAIEGDFIQVGQEQLAALLNPLIVDGFLQLPLMDVKETLEQHPWIAEVNISRRWPDTLIVTVKEQQAIARWSDQGFLNQYGEVIEVIHSDYLESLPLLSGQNDQANVLMQRYQQFSQLLQPFGLNIKAFQADASRDMSVQLDNGMEIMLGQDQVIEQLQRFMLVLERSLKHRLDEINVVDLRYNNGLAVGWRNQEGDQHEIDVIADAGQ